MQVQDFGKVSFLIAVLFDKASAVLVENLIARTLSMMAAPFVAIFVCEFEEVTQHLQVLDSPHL